MRRGMKMAAVSTISLLLLCCSAISYTDSKEVCNLYAKTGADVTVSMTSTLRPSDMLKWMYNDEIIFHRRREKVVRVRDEKRESVSENGFLKLTNVMKSDAGRYTPIVYDSDGKTKGTSEVHHLCVMDRVPEPSVKIECKTISDVTYVVLTCVVQAKAKDLQFAWLQSNKSLEKETAQILKKPINQVKPDPISCKVSNLVSSLTSAPVTHKCFVDNPIFPTEIFGINTWILVGAGGGLVVVLIFVVIVCCICSRRRKHMRLKEEGELRLEWTNDQQHPPDQQHLHPHRPQQQPAGNTGPRQQRSRQQRDQQRLRAAAADADHPNPRPQASPRRPAQAPRPPGQVDEEQPPPLPQPRKNAAKTQRV